VGILAGLIINSSVRRTSDIVTERLGCVFLVALFYGCAVRERAPVFMDATLEYPHPDDEKCGTSTSAVSQLTVTVEDESGAPFPDTPVYLARGDVSAGSAPAPFVVAGQTNKAGVATLEAPGGPSYAVLVTLTGFMPAVRALQLTGGCSGMLTVVLSVASTESLSALRGSPRK
jgi:hypothetical protein